MKLQSMTVTTYIFQLSNCDCNRLHFSVTCASVSYARIIALRVSRPNLSFNVAAKVPRHGYIGHASFETNDYLLLALRRIYIYFTEVATNR